MAGSEADKLNVDSIIQRLLEGEKCARAPWWSLCRSWTALCLTVSVVMLLLSPVQCAETDRERMCNCQREKFEGCV